jgi:hypothetical protein
MYAQFDGFEIKMTKSEAESMAHSGDCELDVISYLKTNKSIHKQLDKIGNKAIAREIKATEAWPGDELLDVEANKRRIVWLAANQIKEEL